ncbi:meiotically up-regulated gene family-domain-containing protein [Nemania abortiva]|nr:meiotically up-regulated gene family-domain-containing protein [Nemania abortiva]
MTTPTASSLSSSSSSSACPIGTISPGFPWPFGDDGPVPPTDLGSSTSSTPASSPSSSTISTMTSTSQVASMTSPTTTTTTPTTPTTTTTQQAPSCSTVTASGAVCTLCSDSTDPQCSAIGPPAPTQTSSNNHGSSLCGGAVSGDGCRAAYARYDENRVYTAYTSYTYLGGLDGCTATFTCNSDAEYAVGMAGWAIIQAFDNLFANDKVKVCGSSYLSNGCHVTVNACSDCKDVNT